MNRRSPRHRPGGTRDFPRTARLNHLVQEIVAEEIERLDDDRLGLLTVVAVAVEADLRHATVWYTSLDDMAGSPAAPGTGDQRPAEDSGDAGRAGGAGGSGAGAQDRRQVAGADGSDSGAELVEALEEHRPRLQAAIARQARLKRTPELSFEPDPVSQSARRVEAILREIGADE